MRDGNVTMWRTGVRTQNMMNSDGVGMLGSPLFHIAGVATLVSAMLLGQTVLLAGGGTFDPSATLDLLGPTLMAGYWNNPTATADAMRGGWFHSGDLVRLDDEGFVYVVDRKKDMSISGGEDIYSSEVESAIDGHPKVREVAVIGVPHPTWVETPLAVVAPIDSADPPSEAEIIEWVKERLAYKKPGLVRVVDALPRNASGKVLKTLLREQFA